MDPGWTNYRRTCLYGSYDVTSMLQPGENALGVMLGNGMYNVPGGRYTKFKGTFGPPKLICQMHVTFADGSTQIVASDETWKCAPGPIVHVHLWRRGLRRLAGMPAGRSVSTTRAGRPSWCVTVPAVSLWPSMRR
jgi:hypothetical protein